MDANGTQYHLLFGEPDWLRCSDEDGHRLASLWAESPPHPAQVHWDARRGDLTLTPQAFRFIASPGDRTFSPDDRRGAARDMFGNWYWIAHEDTGIRVRSAGSDAVTPFWPPARDAEPVATPRDGSFHDPDPLAPTPCHFHGLAVTDDHYLVAGAIDEEATPDDPAHLLVFDLHAGGPPLELRWPAGTAFRPFDIAARPTGGVWILDREHRTLWELDRHFRLVNPLPGDSPPTSDGADFADARPQDSSELPSPPHGCAPLPLSPWTPTIVLVDDGADPIAIDSIGDGGVLVLEREIEAGSLADTVHSRVSHYRRFARAGSPLSLDTIRSLIEEKKRDEFQLTAHDFALARGSQRLFVVPSEGNQAFTFSLITDDTGSLRLTPEEAYFPIRLFSGRALIAVGDAVHYDLGDVWLPLIEQVRPRYEPSAIVLTPVFDSEIPECVWHRVMLDASIPHEASITVASRAADDETTLASAPFDDEPRPILRVPGSELPYAAGETCRPTHELLIQRARGRYAQLQITLRGNKRNTPRLRALRAYYPRFSYAKRYLPACYREESESASFLERFLANMEGVFTGIEDRIAMAQWLLDARSAPRESLDWLATWWGVALDPSWPPGKKRLFIRYASEFFRWRGTIHGVRAALRLVFDPCVSESIFIDVAGNGAAAKRIRIVERFRTRRTPGVVLGDASDGPQAVQPLSRWQPAQGAATLHNRYREAIGAADASVEFSIHAPSETDALGTWTEFCSATLGFVPSITDEDAPLWTAFLERRYLSLARLPAAYGTGWSAFSGIPIPTSLPSDATRLADWYFFESVVLATREAAHRFRVLLPVAPGVRNASDRLRQLQLADQIIRLEKPAHTVFDVKFYWALFRVGEARLGEDTLLGQGSRAPELLPELILGEAYLSEATLVAPHPFNVRNRFVVGRDPLT